MSRTPFSWQEGRCSEIEKVPLQESEVVDYSVQIMKIKGKSLPVTTSLLILKAIAPV